MLNRRVSQAINAILKQLNATTLPPQKTLGELTLDHAGYLLFFMHLHLKFRCFPLEYVESLSNLDSVTGQAIIDRINENVS